MVSTKIPSLIITLKIDDTSQQFFDAQRKLYYPAYANNTAAHITLLYKLSNTKQNIDELIKIAEKWKCFDVEISNIELNKQHIAYTLTSATLLHLHKNLQDHFKDQLIKKDLEIFLPHVTIQNKVTPYKAQKTYFKIMTAFKPFSCKAIGIDIMISTNKKMFFEAAYLFT